MKREYWIKSKLHVVPRKGSQVFGILLNICLILILLSGLISILAEGFQIGKVGYMCISWLIVSGYRKRRENTAHYEFSLAQLFIDAALIRICYTGIEQYQGKSYIVEIPVPQIQVLEYSDKLCCMHIGGAVRRFLEGDKKQDVGTDHYLYMEKDHADEIIHAVESVAAKSVVYMDR